MSAITIHHQNPLSYCIRGNLEFVSKMPALRNEHRNAHGTLGSYITSKGARVKKESHIRTVRDCDISLLVKLLYFALK
jgi:hypothetical protein